MSEQKDEFEKWYDAGIKAGIFDTLIPLQKYQEIKAKNVCKNCLHLKAATEYRDYRCDEIDDIANEGLYLDEDVSIKFSCNRFQHVTGSSMQLEQGLWAYCPKNKIMGWFEIYDSGFQFLPYGPAVINYSDIDWLNLEFFTMRETK